MAFGETKLKTAETAIVAPANIIETQLRVVGTAPLVVNKFSAKAKAKMMADMSTPKAAKKGKAARDPRDFAADFLAAQHLFEDGSPGIAASAFRTAMIDACRTVGLVMTKAKMSVFVLADGLDVEDGTPLVRIISKSPPERYEALVRNDNGSADVRVRPMWREWGALVRLSFDADMITAESVVNLLDRAGRQVGIGEGRPYSKNSTGMGFGTFIVAPE